MSAVREVVNELVIPLDPKHLKDFKTDIPIPFVETEPDIAKVLDLWTNSFRPSLNKLWHLRRSAFGNHVQKKAVFKSGVENLCADFSRRTENIKVQIEVIGQGDAYNLKIVKLSIVPESIRNARSILAEIPGDFLHEAEAHLLAQEGEAQRDNTAESDEPEEAEVLYSFQDNGYEGPSTTTFAQLSVAQEVVVPATTSPVLAVGSRKPALERMQELESIKQFLTVSEYASKKQAILDSI